MGPRRIVTNIATDGSEAAEGLCACVMGMKVVVGLGWAMTFATDAQTAPQISFSLEDARCCRTRSDIAPLQGQDFIRPSRCQGGAEPKNPGPADSGGAISRPLQGSAVALQERQPAMAAIGKYRHVG